MKMRLFYNQMQSVKRQNDHPWHYYYYHYYYYTVPGIK